MPWVQVHLIAEMPEKTVSKLKRFINYYDSYKKFKKEEKEMYDESKDEYISKVSDREICFDIFRIDEKSIGGIGNWISKRVNVIGSIGKWIEPNEVLREWTWIATKFPAIKGEISIENVDDEDEYKEIGRIYVENGKCKFIASKE